MRRRLTTVIDSTGLEAGRRAAWVATAREAGIPAYAIVFDPPEDLVHARNRERGMPVPRSRLRPRARTSTVLARIFASSPSVSVESLDIRATIPALLNWAREQGCTLTTMRAEPVTLTDVFAALTERRLQVTEGRD